MKINKHTLYIFMGVSGSGKSTTAAKLVGSDNVFAADDYFYKGDNYFFDSSKLKDAHANCQERVKLALLANTTDIAIANTNVKLEHMKPYIDLADMYKYNVQFIVTLGNFGDTHSVPVGAKIRQAMDLRTTISNIISASIAKMKELL